MFDQLTERLERAFKSLSGQGRVTEINVASTLKEIRRALVDADVNYNVAREFTDKVKEKAIGSRVLTAVSPGQQLVKVMADELTALMGGNQAPINLKGSPAVILIAGLQGSGKTTFAAKLALHLKTRMNYDPLLVAGDVYRPAAIEQIRVLAAQAGVKVYSEEKISDPAGIAKRALAEARTWGNNPVIIDTAGRLAVDEEMMNEITRVKNAVSPSETLFVVDSMTGQDAVNTARVFNERLGFDGVVLTKLDGDTRGGAAISITYTVGKPVKFISSGEKLDTISDFHPERMARRILGMGDILTFVEKAQEQYDEKETQQLKRKIHKNQLDFNDFLAQLAQVKKMGNIKDLLGMIPGAGKALKNIDIDEKQFTRIEAMIGSMTPAEREDPSLMNGSRKKRIAEGSGHTIQELNLFLKQFDDMRKMMRTAAKKGGMKLPAGRR